MPAGWDKDKVDVIDNGKGKSVPLPKGFYYVGGNIDTGIVISDKEGDTLESSGVNMGNQFVWIPVASEADLKITDFDSSTGKSQQLDYLQVIQNHILADIQQRLKNMIP